MHHVVFPIKLLRHAKINNFQYALIAGEKDIEGFEVLMYNEIIMNKLDSRNHLAAKLLDLLDRYRRPIGCYEVK